MNVSAVCYHNVRLHWQLFSPPGKKTACKHWWECRGGRRVRRGQRWWDGGWLQADEWRCMFPVWSFTLFIISICQSYVQALSNRWNVDCACISCVLWFIFIGAVVMECSPLLPCLCSLSWALGLSLLFVFVSFFLCGCLFSFPALLSFYWSLLLFNCCLLLSKWKVLYKKKKKSSSINHRNVTESCATFSHPACEILKSPDQKYWTLCLKVFCDF